MTRKEIKKADAESMKRFQAFHHISDDELEFFEYLHKRERVFKIIILILMIVISALLILK